MNTNFSYAAWPPKGIPSRFQDLVRPLRAPRRVLKQGLAAAAETNSSMEDLSSYCSHTLKLYKDAKTAPTSFLFQLMWRHCARLMRIRRECGISPRPAICLFSRVAWRMRRLPRRSNDILPTPSQSCQLSYWIERRNLEKTQTSCK